MKKCLIVLIVLFLGSCALGSDTPWQTLSDPTAAELAAKLLDPPPEYSMTFYWGWDGPVTREMITRDLYVYSSKNIKAVTIEAGNRMQARYLSPEWFELIAYTVEQAKQRGMRVWLVDEGKYPSGFGGGFNFNAFERILIDDLIPFVDANYRTMADQPHRAMAGLSMVGMQTRQITLAHLDVFSHIGFFSGGSISMADVNNTPGFKEKIKLVFVGYGSRELDNRGGGRGGFGGDPKTNIETLKQAGINAVLYVSPETAHEWHTWRRNLHEFAPLLFTDH